MSGGVDSAVAAYLLKKSGYEVIGITLRTWQSDDGGDSRCCEIDVARETANRIGIKYYPINCTMDFKKYVVDPFIEEYINGMTPNPCVECNRYVKWDKLLYYSKVLGADYIATGHYATVVKLANGRYSVKKAIDSQKDQTYMLYKLTQEHLSKTLMPLGNLVKSEVREIARDVDLQIASKPDSQEICFVTNGNYADFIKYTAKKDSKGEGFFVDTSGNTLGKHKGIMHYTIGQRKGLGIELGYRAYVKEIRVDRNEVVLGNESSLYHKELLCRDVNFMSISKLDKNEKIRCTVKARYRHDGQPAQLVMIDKDMIKVSFYNPVRAATPGQSAVFYDDEGCIIGGGIIEKILDK